MLVCVCVREGEMCWCRGQWRYRVLGPEANGDESTDRCGHRETEKGKYRLVMERENSMLGGTERRTGSVE